MKKMKKLLAFVLAFAMIITIYQPTSAYAATKKPVLSAKSITLQVGKQKTLKVKNAGKNATIQWSSSKKTVAAVSKKGVVKAVKAGTAKVICKVTTKQNKNYKLVCKVVVKNAPVKTVSRTVTNQQELEAALKAKNLSKLIIKTDDETAFTIPEGTYNKVALVVDAPKADVTNNAKFKSVAIKAIKPDTYRENAKGNTIIVSAANARVIIEAGASVTNITVSQANGSVKLVVDGALSGITLDAPAAVTVEGKNTTAVPVTVNEKAANATISSSTPVEVKAAAPVSVTLTKGAEGSKVETTTDKAEVTVKNDTTAAVTVVTPAGNKEVAKDSTAKVDNTGKISDTNANTNAGGSTSGGSVTPTPTPDPTPSETYTLYALHLFAANQMDVEIPEKITDKDKIEVRDADGNLQKVAELKDMYADEDDEEEDEEDDVWQRYMITFASDLTPGKYTFSYTGKTKIYQGTVQFAAESFAKTKAAAEKVQAEIFGQTFDILPKGKDDVVYAADQLDYIIGDYANENNFWAGVYNYAENYTISEDGKVGLEVKIRVQGDVAENDQETDQDVVQDVTGTVYFTFNKQPEEVKVPQVVFKTQTSIVIKAEDGQQYICIPAEENPTENDWYQSAYANNADDFGNLEFDGLSIGKSYRIWSRNIKEADVEQKSDEITLTEKNPQIVCLADSDEKVLNLGTVTTSEEDDRVIQIPRSVKISNYGQVPENMYLHGETDNVVLMKDGQKIESGVSVSLPHSDLAEVYSVDGFEKGEYTLTYDYYYCCSDKDTGLRAVGSPAVTYQVTFTIE